MPVVPAAEAIVHEMHGIRFVSYIVPAHGSKELCAWRGEIPAGTAGPAHTITREEVFLMLSGSLRFSIDGEVSTLVPGDAAVAPAGSSLGVSNPTEEPATMWVTTSVGLEAVLADGSRISPPWVN
ncbi:cupin domain-containing protein [Streptomyces sp. H10-C2]|uniref:cupin domain-containing protein n=1 Tax=unclassified Streptomyces TaxID=2593676 RepID=UPI0024BB3860|nr:MULTISPECIES: cupin domain-containing protein [unclassified Streptomyces]MDJ0343126.1 cupin domain-containing protein [Streptomyces sp. PH10-H1]MDJ0371068.1 cupin domain-containing protein [Streptomyces sp. H10-C2]